MYKKMNIYLIAEGMFSLAFGKQARQRELATLRPERRCIPVY